MNEYCIHNGLNKLFKVNESCDLVEPLVKSGLGVGLGFVPSYYPSIVITTSA